MLINEVCSKVGLSRKSIRYYEEEGLLRPNRNNQNDYRIYSDEDIALLEKIKFLRELGVSINDIKDLFSKKIGLGEVLNARIEKIEEENDKYLKVKELCLEIINNNIQIENLNDNYTKEMNILNKEGFTLRDVSVNSNKGKKIFGAVMSTFIFTFMFAALSIIITYFQLTESEKMPWLMFIFFQMILLLPVLGAIYNLIIRIKEINGGEEDEASKY